MGSPHQVPDSDDTSARPDAENPSTEQRVSGGAPEVGDASREGSPRTRAAESKTGSAAESFDVNPRTKIKIKKVIASDSVFGTAAHSAAPRETVTGAFDEVIISTAISIFVRPPNYDHALERLERDRWVVLTGPSGRGKRTSAIHLLRARASTAKVVGLSPLMTLKALAEYRFRPGHVYLVINHRPTAEQAADRWHQLARISERMRSSAINSYLVLTLADQERHHWESGQALLWSTPDSQALVSVYLRHHELELSDEYLSLVTEIAQNADSVSETVDLLNRLAKDPARAREVIEDAQRRRSGEVAAWFPASMADDVLATLTALAFLPRTPLYVVERFASKLEELLATKSDGRKKQKKVEGIRQARINDTTFPFARITTTREGIFAGEITVEFSHTAFHRETLEALRRRYTHGLWDCVTIWLRTIVQNFDTDVATDLAILREISTSVGMLAEHSYSYVMADLVSPWVDGQLSEIFAAAWTIEELENNAETQGQGLHLATRWLKSGSTSHAQVAVIALMGDIGIKYPNTILNELARFAWSGGNQEFLAHIAITNLFAISVRSPNNGSRVLSFCRQQMEQAATRRSSNAGRIQEWSLRLALDVVQAVDPIDGRSVCATLLNRDPRRTPDIAGLLTPLLRSLPTRKLSIEALRDILRDAGTGAHASAILQEMATELSMRLGRKDGAALRRDFVQVFRRRDDDINAPKQDYSEFVNNLIGKDEDDPGTETCSTEHKDCEEPPDE